MQAYVESVLAIIIIIGNQLRQWTVVVNVHSGLWEGVSPGIVVSPVLIESPFL